MVEYHKLYLRKLEILSSTHLPPPACNDGTTAVQTGNPSATKFLVLIFHDESSFHANDGQSVMWAEEGRVPIRLKNQGRGLMVSDFVTEFDRLLQLSIEERTATAADPSVRMYPAVRGIGTIPDSCIRWRMLSRSQISNILQQTIQRGGCLIRVAVIVHIERTL